MCSRGDCCANKNGISQEKRNAINEKETILRSLLKVDSNINIPVIGLGELFEINGFTKKLCETSGKNVVLLDNKFSYHKSRNIYPIIGVLNKVEEYDFKKTVTKENVSTVTRGE